MKHLAICLPLLLAGCSGATIVSSSLPCRPPAEVMAKAEMLTPITNSNMTMTEIIQQMLQDNLKYNILKNKDDALIDWIGDHCQK
jgi:hypothetical protein